MKFATQALLVALLVSAIAAPALAADVKSYVHHQVPGPRVAFQCDDGYLDNAYFQNQSYVYGNAFSVGAGGQLSWVDYWHHGWFTWSGPSDYNIRVYDDMTCTEVAFCGPFSADDAYSIDVEEIEDMCPCDIFLTGDVAVLLEPLSCAAPNDCYPDVYFDMTGPIDGCDRLFPIALPDCTPYFAGDFVFRIGVDECVPSATKDASWGDVKALFR